MTTSEPKSSGPDPLAEGPSTAEAKDGSRPRIPRPWLPGIYRLESARSLLKALSGKSLLDTPRLPPDSK